MLGMAGHAPGGEGIDQADLALMQVRRLEAGIRTPGRRQVELRRLLADERRGQLLRVEPQALVEEDGQDAEDEDRQDEVDLAAHAHSAAPAGWALVWACAVLTTGSLRRPDMAMAPPSAMMMAPPQIQETSGL